MARVLVSAAHTSIAPGEIFEGLREFDLTKKILNLVVPYLEKEKIDFKAVPIDLQLLNRIDWINNSGYTEEQGDIFIEIHVNDGGKRGIETWFSHDKDEKGENNSENLAKIFTEELCKLTTYEDRGVKSEHEHELKSLLILNQTKPIAIATELLYIDNPEDRAILQDDKKLDELAKNFVLAVKKYLDSNPKIHAAKPKSNSFSLPGFTTPPAPSFGNFGSDNDSDDFGLNVPSFGGLGGGAPAAPAKNNNLMMDREQRKKMIEDTYKELVDSEPKQADMNYYLNTGISEEDLIKKIVKSEEHKNLVKDAKDAKEMRESSKKNEAELIQLRAQINDLNRMHANFNMLLQHKNTLIKQLQDKLIEHGILQKGQYFDQTRTNQNQNFMPGNNPPRPTQPQGNNPFRRIGL